MADINVERKGPSIWPWIIGLLVLALLIWAIAEMVDTDEPEVAEVTEVEQPVAAVPTPEPEPGVAEAPPIANLMPLDPSQDEGAVVTVSGQVIAEPIRDGFWVRTEQNDAVFVKSHRDVGVGQNVSLVGDLHRAHHHEIDKWMKDAELAEAEDVTVQTSMYVKEDEHAVAPGTQPGAVPGTQNETTPNDAGRGQY